MCDGQEKVGGYKEAKTVSALLLGFNLSLTSLGHKP